MPNVAYLNVEMKANTANFAANVDKATKKTENYARIAEKAAKKTKGYSKEIDKAKEGSEKFAENTKRAANALAILHGPLNGVAGRLSSISAGFKAFGVVATLSAVTAATSVAGVSAVLFKGIRELTQAEQQILRGRALLKATDYASGFTSDQLDKQAKRIALNTLASTEGIRDAQAVMLTFKSVSGETFTEAIELSQDLAAVMGGDAKSGALQLGKALEDPVRGITALRRAGVSFTAQEQEKIKILVESNKMLEAQTLVVQKLKEQVGGAGSAEAGGLAGSTDTLNQRLQELTIALVQLTGAGEGYQYVIDRIAKGMAITTDAILPAKAEDLFSRRIELVAELNEAQEKLSGFTIKGDFQNNLPVPGVYKKRRREAEAEVRDLEAELSKIDGLMQGQIDANNKRISQEEAAYNKMLEQQKLMREQAAEAKRIADEEERRLEAQKASIKLAQSRTSKADSLYQKLFAGDKEKPKNYSRNFAFEADAKSAKRALDDGLGGAAKHFIDQAEASYRAAKNYGSASNYDLQGMKDVVIALREAAGIDFKDPDRKRNSGSGESSGKSMVELTRENGDQLKLVADSSREMADKVGKYLDTQNKVLQQVNNQNSPSKKFVLELSVPGKNKNISITAESKEDFESSMANLLEGAAAGI